jgi:dihydroorotase-like cyclic amidohydrolase
VVSGGICSFKLYTTYNGMVVDDKTIYKIFARLKELGGIAGVHCENRGIIDARLRDVVKRRGDRRNVSDYPWTLSAKSQQSRSDYCPLEGIWLTGRAEQVYLRGTLAAHNDEILRAYGRRYVTAKRV